jgi:hypothetical protein
MNELILERIESSNEASGQEDSACPLQALHTQWTLLDADDELVLPKHKRVVTSIRPTRWGHRVAHIAYSDGCGGVVGRRGQRFAQATAPGCADGVAQLPVG